MKCMRLVCSLSYTNSLPSALFIPIDTVVLGDSAVYGGISYYVHYNSPPTSNRT